MKRKVTKKRPEDEVRGQLRYGSESSWMRHHRLGRDIAGVDTTLILGVDPDSEILVALDPQACELLPMGNSFYMKDRQVDATKKEGWHVWEAETRDGTKRAARSPSFLETLISCTPGESPPPSPTGATGFEDTPTRARSSLLSRNRGHERARLIEWTPPACPGRTICASKSRNHRHNRQAEPAIGRRAGRRRRVPPRGATPTAFRRRTGRTARYGRDARLQCHSQGRHSATYRMQEREPGAILKW